MSGRLANAEVRVGVCREARSRDLERERGAGTEHLQKTRWKLSRRDWRGEGPDRAAGRTKNTANNATSVGLAETGRLSRPTTVG